MTQSVTPSQALVRAVAIAGGQSATARICNKSQSAVWKWLQSERSLPAEHVLAMEAATGVHRHLLRPDIYPISRRGRFPRRRLCPGYADGTAFCRLRSARQSATREGGGMTKLRTPLSFSRAITTIAAAIGWEAAAKVTGRSVRTVRHWSERPSRHAHARGVALDRAFIAAGGDHGPILSSYGLQLDVALVDAVACRTALAEDIAATTRETGDAISHCIQALHPGATPAQIYRAIAETEEADALFPRLLGRLKALLPGTGAGREATGEMR
jgi:DNA-binding transcriptional regulator YdaS (Cro superfamily)